MSHNRHRHNVHRQTSLDIYNDAAKILEELLEKGNYKNLRAPHRFQRNKTDPNSEIVTSFITGSNSADVRGNTVLLRNSHSLDNELDKDLNSLLLENAYNQKTIAEHHGGSESSIDTDDDQAQVSDKRTKKSLIKMAKERLRQTFHRDHKDTNKSSNDSSTCKRQKSKNAPKLEEISKSYPRMNVQAGKDRTIEFTEERSKDALSVKKGKGLNFIPFTKLKKKTSTEEYPYIQKEQSFGSPKESNNNGNNKPEDEKCVSEKGQPSSLQESSSADVPPSPGVVQNSEIKSNRTPSPKSYRLRTSKGHIKNVNCLPQPSPIHLSSDRNTSSENRALSSQSRSPSPSKSLNLTAAMKSGIITPGITSTSSCIILEPDNTSDGSANVLSSSHSNVLDSPGEDIEYMDVDSPVTTNRNSNIGGENHTRIVHAAGALFDCSEGMPNVNISAGQASGGIHSLNFEIDQRVISTQTTDGNIETTSTVNSVSVVVSQGSEEALFEMLPINPQKSGFNRDVIYGKIAQKLIEMGDYYSTSDQDLEGATAAQPASLTDLEKDIIACLRTGGDRHSKQLDDSIEEAAQQTTQEAYQRFQITMQNSMGNDLSWDHLACLFYATKGVVSAVGEGSRKANRAKEFTLQYISDTFASWIMDQGGFDSVLSSGESDFDVD